MSAKVFSRNRTQRGNVSRSCSPVAQINRYIMPISSLSIHLYRYTQIYCDYGHARLYGGATLLCFT